MKTKRGVEVKVFRDRHPSVKSFLAGSGLEQRIEMMWPLALEAWEFKGEPVREPRLPRHVVVLKRSEG
jgi:hypothetical protein